MIKVRYIASVLFFVFLLAPLGVFAQGGNEDFSLESSNADFENGDQYTSRTVKAKVLEILENKDLTDENGQKNVLQRIRLNEIGSDKEIIYDGISQNSTTKKVYSRGDKVLVTFSDFGQGETIQITDSIRTFQLWIAAFLLAIVAILVARIKGLKALFSLGVTAFIVVYAIVPLVVSGMDPLLVVVVFSIPILAITIYLTHGFNRQSHIALLGTFAGVVSVGLLSLVFAKISNLSGFADEEVVYIAGLLKDRFNPYSLLLAGFVIGSLGVLDDIALTQVSAVREIRMANPSLGRTEIYKRAMRVGVDHVSSVINTLFLAYVGTGFSLLLLFSYRQPPFENAFMIFNNEILATEIIRTIVGSIGVLLVIPVTTLLAAKFGD